MDLNGGATPSSVVSREEETAGGPAPDLRPRPLPRRLLVIEDAPLQRQVLTFILRKAGYHVTDAALGHEGLRRLREDPPDLVLTDLHLPDLTGWEIARTIRRLRPDLPIVLVTGCPGVMSAPPGLRALVSAIVPKPFDIRELLDLVGRLAAPCGARLFLE